MHPSRILILAAVIALCGCRDTKPAAPTTTTGSAPVTAGHPVLGAPPLCEPSALLPAPWNPNLLLVADNEDHRGVFGFTRGDDGLLTGQVILPIPKAGRPRDAEAMTVFDNALMVVSSHSRNKRCEVKKKRRTLSQFRWDEDQKALQMDRTVRTHHQIEGALASEDACTKGLFVAPAPRFAPALCRALVSARHEASAERCDTLNIEGAVNLEGRIWLGLRSPLVDGKAVVVRIAWPHNALEIDAVNLLDLGGRGVRELALAQGRLWVIAGPARDAKAPFEVWEVDPESLAGDPSPRRVASVPTSSEGLLVDDKGFLTVIDGAEGDDRTTCEEPGRQSFTSR